MPSLKIDGHQLTFDDSGAGEVLLLVHGAASSGLSFQEIVPRWGQSFRVVAPDLRGMGRSERISEMPPTAWNDDLLALMDQLEIARWHAVGTTLGGRLVLRLAVDHPDRIISVTADAPKIANNPEGDAALERLFADLPAPHAEQFARWNGADWRSVLDTYLKLRGTPGLPELYDLDRHIDEISCPVFVTRGDKDDEIHPLSDAVELHARIPGSLLWVAPDTGGPVMQNRPAEFVAHLERFVSELSPTLPVAESSSTVRPVSGR